MRSRERWRGRVVRRRRRRRESRWEEAASAPQQERSREGRDSRADASSPPGDETHFHAALIARICTWSRHVFRCVNVSFLKKIYIKPSQEFYGFFSVPVSFPRPAAAESLVAMLKRELCEVGHLHRGSAKGRD